MNAFGKRTRGAVLRLIRGAVLRLIKEEAGQDLVEYALLTGIVAVAALIAIPTASCAGQHLRDVE